MPSLEHRQRVARSEQPAASFWASRRAVLLAAMLVIVAGIAAYANSFSGPFVLDDIGSILENPTIRRITALGDVLSPPHGNGATVGGRPVLNLSLALNYAVSGTEVWSYHAFNLLIHLAGGLLLLGIVRRTLVQSPCREPFAAHAWPLALTIAILWTVHPLQTEAVTYVVQRAESLMGFFYLLTLYAFVRGAESPRPARWHALAGAACLLGMGTKEVMVSAPLVVLLYDRTFVAGSFRAAWQRRRRLYLVLASTWLVLTFLVISTGGNRGGTVGLGVGIPWWAYWATQFRAIVWYLCLVGWPHPLVFYYETRWAHSAAEVIPYAVIVLALLAVTVWSLWRRPSLGFLGVFFFSILAPTSLMPGTTQLIVEHRMYLPLAAVLAAVVLALHRWIGQRGFLLWALAVVGAITLTVQRNADYRSEFALWRDTATKQPGNALADYNLGNCLLALGQVDDAIACYERALRVEPWLPEVHDNLGNALLRKGRPEEAVAHYEQALAVNPRHSRAHANLATALLQLNRPAAAIAHLEQALQIDPRNVAAHDNLGNALCRLGRFADAIPHFEQALRIDPNSAAEHYNLGNALLQLGRPAEAIPHYAAALRLRSDFPEAHSNWAAACFALGRSAEAEAHYEAVLRLRPEDAAAHYNLGNLLVQQNQLAAAAVHYEAALRLRPEFPEAHNNLGDVLVQQNRVTEGMRHFEAALRERPEYVEAHANLAHALAGIGRSDEAIAHYETVLHLQLDYPSAQEELARLRSRR